MLRYFRHIRKKLIASDNVRKYLLYALGEILLVVIGILIALQINNWNEKRKTRILEQQLLGSLLQEFETNLEILEQTVSLNKYVIEKGIALGKFTGPNSGDFDETELSTLMVDVFKHEPRYVPNQGTVNEIINSGRLSVLSDPELRKAISAWQSELESVKNQEDYVIERRDLGHDFFLQEGNFRRHLNIIKDPLIDVAPSRFPDNDFEFLKNQEFESQLYLFIVASENLNQTYYAPLRMRIESITELIKKGIDAEPN